MNKLLPSVKSLITLAALLCFLFHQRPLQNLKKSQLKLIRFHFVNIIKRTVERIIILIWKTCDQIQMLMNISKTVDLCDRPFQFHEIHVPVDCMNGVRICGL